MVAEVVNFDTDVSLTFAAVFLCTILNTEGGRMVKEGRHLYLKFEVCGGLVGVGAF